MFILVAVIIIICGVLLLLKAKKMPDKKGICIVSVIFGIVLIVCGITLVYHLITGDIVLPLH